MCIKKFLKARWNNTNYLRYRFIGLVNAEKCASVWVCKIKILLIANGFCLTSWREVGPFSNVNAA
ncbi:MAG: hypothetical protein OHK003_15310 [Anaerolineales bacterium]